MNLFRSRDLIVFELFMSHVRYVPSRPIQGTKWSTVAMGDIRNICLGIGELGRETKAINCGILMI
jgi:hypothetical protein